ncbi:hypothetical protein ACET3Z_008071 [Daucus carota]
MLLKASTSDSVLAMPRSVGSQVHAQIVKSDTEADDVLYTALVYSYVKSGRVNYARRVFDLMMEKNVVCSTCMISGYMEQGCVEEAEEIFKKTVEKDVVVYNAMIEGYSKSVETSKRAIDVFIDMQRMDYRPTISTFASIFGACSILSAVEVGQQVQGQLTKTKFFNDIKMGTAAERWDTVSEIREVMKARGISKDTGFSWVGADGNLEGFHAGQKM